MPNMHALLCTFVCIQSTNKYTESIQYKYQLTGEIVCKSSKLYNMR